MIMKIVIAGGMFVHGFAHLVGFLVPWRLANLDDTPYRTTLLAGKLDIGDWGIRLVGVVWLIAAIAFGVAAGALLLNAPWWLDYTMVVSTASLILCILGWPDSRFGVFINIAIIAYLFLGPV
jgi:hypothetical protein